jgi:uncharacterized repeat protein (TIGR04042 family)
MPEMHFTVAWPDGVEEACYSPSLVIKDYFEPGQSYGLTDFLARCRTALSIASDRVQAKFGMPCSLALGQLARIEHAALRFPDTPDAPVRILFFAE